MRMRRMRFLQCFYLLPSFALSVPQSVGDPQQAEVHIWADSILDTFSKALLGTNLAAHRNRAVQTVENGQFIDSTRYVAPTMIRWPGGTISDHYDWKKREVIEAGRRRRIDDLVNLEDIVVFARTVGAELTITINFGTMHAQDAADLVEFCNGPSTSFWGQKRDSILVAHGFSPGPLNVRYFEIGNETYAQHTYETSWTARHPAKYFLGGEAERRGAIRVTIGGQQAFFPLGDLFEIRAGDPGTTYFLRFPPVKNVAVRLFADRAAIETCLLTGTCNFETFKQVETLAGQSADARVFVLDSLTGSITFGDGNEGFRPPPGSFILVEYTTYGHDGFVAMARQMRAVPPACPSKSAPPCYRIIPPCLSPHTSRWIRSVPCSSKWIFWCCTITCRLISHPHAHTTTVGR